MKQLIYLHTINLIPYIGQTKFTMEKRLKDHICNARNKHSSHFYNAIRKYGDENITSIILEDNIPMCSNLETKQLLIDEREIFWIKKYDSYKNGYNQTVGGGSMIGYTHTEEACLKMSVSKMGEKNHNYGKPKSEEFKQTLSKSNSGSGNGMFGKDPWNKGKKTGKLSKEHRAKISQSMMGKNKKG